MHVADTSMKYRFTVEQLYENAPVGIDPEAWARHIVASAGIRNWYRDAVFIDPYKYSVLAKTPPKEAPFDDLLTVEQIKRLTRSRTGLRKDFDQTTVRAVFNRLAPVLREPVGGEEAPARPANPKTHVVVRRAKSISPKAPGVRGPGDHMHKAIYEKYGIAPCQRCMQIINRMNQLGVAGCRKRKNEIIDDIWERRNMLKGWKAIAVKLPGSSIAGKIEIGKLFDAALQNAEQESKNVKTTSGDNA